MSRKSQTSETNSALNSLDLGTIEFMKWLISKDTNSWDTWIVVKDYFDNKYVILFDKSILSDVIVAYRDVCLWCMTCNTDDCGHVGFAKCLKQDYDRNDQMVL